MTNELIVNQDIREVNASYENMMRSFEVLEEYLAKLTVQLEDTGWSGESHDKCVDIQSLITHYEQGIRNLVIGFKDSGSVFDNGINDFASNSRSAERLRMW
ncbi:MAG: hypothetical protein LBC96_07875 [Lachnospiraceae bacterium]|nr:hypothetical protein [Lachnospiraceae bacterium]